jgi:hypothetical protein
VEASAIRDLKTSRSGDKYHSQGGGYIMLEKANGVNTPTEFVVDWLPRKTINKPYPMPVEYRYSAALCELEARAVVSEVMRQLTRYQEADGDPSVVPNNTSSMLCSPKYCRAYGTDVCPVSKTFTA